ETGGVFSLDASDGTDKTYLINLLLAKVRQMSMIVLAPHSMKLPWNVRIASRCFLNPPERSGRFHAHCYDERRKRP
ncbi:hypothetical protein AVEN_65427-1, partial [Araneus ventricosus]